MHIDANIEIVKDTNNRMLMAGTKRDIAFDFDYCDDFDDVIQAIEEKIFEDFKISLTYNVDFIITNADDICEEFGYQTQPKHFQLNIYSYLGFLLPWIALFLTTRANECKI